MTYDKLYDEIGRVGRTLNPPPEPTRRELESYMASVAQQLGLSFHASQEGGVVQFEGKNDHQWSVEGTFPLGADTVLTVETGDRAYFNSLGEALGSGGRAGGIFHDVSVSCRDRSIRYSGKSFKPAVFEPLHLYLRDGKPVTIPHDSQHYQGLTNLVVQAVEDGKARFPKTFEVLDWPYQWAHDHYGQVVDFGSEVPAPKASDSRIKDFGSEVPAPKASDSRIKKWFRTILAIPEGKP